MYTKDKITLLTLQHYKIRHIFMYFIVFYLNNMPLSLSLWSICIVCLPLACGYPVLIKKRSVKEEAQERGKQRVQQSDQTTTTHQPYTHHRRRHHHQQQEPRRRVLFVRNRALLAITQDTRYYYYIRIIWSFPPFFSLVLPLLLHLLQLSLVL